VWGWNDPGPSNSGDGEGHVEAGGGHPRAGRGRWGNDPPCCRRGDWAECRFKAVLKGFQDSPGLRGISGPDVQKPPQGAEKREFGFALAFFGNEAYRSGFLLPDGCGSTSADSEGERALMGHPEHTQVGLLFRPGG